MTVTVAVAAATRKKRAYKKCNQKRLGQRKRWAGVVSGSHGSLYIPWVRAVPAVAVGGQL